MPRRIEIKVGIEVKRKVRMDRNIGNKWKFRNRQREREKKKNKNFRYLNGKEKPSTSKVP